MWFQIITFILKLMSSDAALALASQAIRLVAEDDKNAVKKETVATALGSIALEFEKTPLLSNQAKKNIKTAKDISSILIDRYHR